MTTTIPGSSITPCRLKDADVDPNWSANISP